MPLLRDDRVMDIEASINPGYCVQTAIDRLEIYLNLPHNPQEAIDMFSQRFEYGLFIYLYRVFFPDDYAASQESNEVDEGWSYSSREVEFLYLVTDRLFPLDIDYISDVGANGDRATEMIYLETYGMPWWYEDFENLAPEWQVLRLLSGTLTDQESDELLTAIKGLPADLIADVQSGCQAMIAASLSVQYSVRTFFLRQDCPYTNFGRVLALYQRNTGNPWLDTDGENEMLYEGYYWCEKHITEIAQTYKQARMYEEQVNSYAKWLGEDTNRIKSLIEKLIQIITVTDQEREIGKERTNDG